MDFQFFEIQFFEKTMKNHETTMKNHAKNYEILMNSYEFPMNFLCNEVTFQEVTKSRTFNFQGFPVTVF